MPRRTEPRLYVNYYGDDGEQWDSDEANHIPSVGSFIMNEGGQTYRVDEVWDLQHKHGAHPWGHHVFLTAIDVMETRLGRSEPSYYRSRND